MVGRAISARLGFGITHVRIAAYCYCAIELNFSWGNHSSFCRLSLGHPNYFGEIFQWWCLFAFSYSSSENPLGGYADPLWWAGIVSPLFTMQILLNMQPTGISNAEGRNLKRYYEKCPERYTKYRDNTSILIPFIGYGYIPKFLKRTIFFDFERYEYKAPAIEKEEWVRCILSSIWIWITDWYRLLAHSHSSWFQ